MTGKPVRVRARRSLEEATIVLCRLHHRMRRLDYSALDVYKRKGLRECLRRLTQGIDREYYHLRKMIDEREVHPQRVRAALRALELIIREDIGLLKNQRLYLLKALSLCAKAKSLDHAFGIAREKRGAPKKSEQAQIEIAANVLRLLLKGEKLESAALQVGRRLNIGATQARQDWAKNKLNAIALVRCERPASSYPWTKNEAKRLARLLARETRLGTEFFRQEDGSDFPPTIRTTPKKAD